MPARPFESYENGGRSAVRIFSVGLGLSFLLSGGSVLLSDADLSPVAGAALAQSSAPGEIPKNGKTFLPGVDPDVATAYARGRYRDAVTLQQSILAGLSRGSSEYKRGLVILTFLQERTESPHQLVFQAREALDADKANVRAAVNLAALELVTGDYADAHRLAAEALGRDREDWLAPIVLAQALANEPGRGKKQALTVLAAAQNLGGKSPPAQKWRLLGETYQLLQEPVLAEKMFLRFISIAESQGEFVDGTLKENLFHAALASGDKIQTSKLLNVVLAANSVKPDTLILLAKKIKFLSGVGSKNFTEEHLQAQIIAVAKKCCSTNGDLFYALGRAFEEASGDGLDKNMASAHALECYELAAAILPDEGKFVLAYCNQLVLAGERNKAQSVLSRLEQALRLKEPSGRRVLVAGLVPAALRLMGGGNPVYAVSRARLEGVKCYCRAGALAYILRHLPGVVFAYVPEGKGALAVVIFDPLLNGAGPEKIWAKLGAEAHPVIVASATGGRDAVNNSPGRGIKPPVVGKKAAQVGRTIKTLPELLGAATAAWEQTYEDPHPHYFFEPLPLRLP